MSNVLVANTVNAQYTKDLSELNLLEIFKRSGEPDVEPPLERYQCSVKHTTALYLIARLQQLGMNNVGTLSYYVAILNSIMKKEFGFGIVSIPHISNIKKEFSKNGKEKVVFKGDKFFVTDFGIRSLFSCAQLYGRKYLPYLKIVEEVLGGDGQ